VVILRTACAGLEGALFQGTSKTVAIVGFQELDARLAIWTA